MSRLTTRTAKKPNDLVQGALDGADVRYHGARPLRTAMNKVFPTHWSFMLGEVALYSFLVLLLSGVPRADRWRPVAQHGEGGQIDRRRREAGPALRARR